MLSPYVILLTMDCIPLKTLKKENHAMKLKHLFLPLIVALFISSCTTIQPRRVTDELYQTPPSQSEQTYATAEDQRKQDTIQDRPSLQSAPYWMYERYPYHPYYHFDPFGYYYPFSFHSYAWYPYYGIGFGYYPYYHSSWYGSWYSPWYAPYYYPYGKVIHKQRKISTLPPARKILPTQNHTGRIRKVAPQQGTRKIRPPMNINPKGSNRKSPAPERYLRATDFLRSVNNQSRPQIRIHQPNLPQRKHYVVPNRSFTRQRMPVIRHSNPIRIQPPVRSGSSTGRKRK